MQKLLALAVAAALPLALVACGGNDAEKAAAKAAAPLPAALEALGIRGLTWRSPRIEEDTVILVDAKAEIDGIGPVRAAEMAVTGFAPSEGGWSASVVRADRVEGGVTARHIAARAPRAQRTGKAWSVTEDGRVFEGYQGPLSGVRVTAEYAASETQPAAAGRPATTHLTAHRLRIPGPTAPDRLRPFAELDWTASVRLMQPSPDRVVVVVEGVETLGWSLHGHVALTGDTASVRALAASDAAALLDLPRWPGGTLLREATLDASLLTPSALVGSKAPDPIAGALAAAGAGPVVWHVQATPREPVPVKDIPGILGAPGADARLGLEATGTGMEGFRGRPGGQAR